MVVQLRKNGDEFTFVLPPQSAQEMNIADGSTVEINPVDASAPVIRYASVEETMEIHRKMEPRHAAAYRELAK
jgi:antitoxin component of MazEF toxin-antitoxin module